MSLEEKAAFCSGRDFWHMEANERLGMASIMLTDGPHGLRKQMGDTDHVGIGNSVPATCFPTACALASSWDRDLLREVGVALGEQCAAENVAVLLGPGMNIKRHPLCGRNFEYFSEDPLVSGELAAALIEGIQSQGVGACVKHFAVNNQEQGRMFVDAIVDERTLREIYLRGFEIAVRKAQPWTVMCAYNRLNGVYCSEHDWLLNQVLRGDWGFAGAVVTDWGAANDRVRGIAAGLDLEMPASGGVNDRRLVAAVRDGRLPEADLDRAVTRNLSLALLGGELPKQRVAMDQDAHHALARRAAGECAVLLK
ncbi:MAG: glycoside hydrolase family 3 protein, partial [Gammaproteobacteria bacterium]|nr:glycoside hydrolase family 3 protein [Gammaproteobacteria bacterium]